MGATSSVQVGNAPAELKEIFEVLDKVKSAMAVSDCQTLQNEQAKMFKSHTNVIQLLTSRTKKQLKKLTDETSVKIADLGNFGGQYGRFLSFLPISRPSVDLQLIELATNGIGCDEDIIASVLCTLPMESIKELCEMFSKSSGGTLADKIKSKTKSDSPFQRFILRVLNCDRYEGAFVDAQAASQHAQSLFNAKSSELTTILDILCYSSRTQCALISSECYKQHKLSLNDLVKKKVGGNTGKYLTYWTSPINEAIANIIRDNKKSQDLILLTIAKYDKLTLSRVNDTCKTLFSTSLQDICHSATSGNFSKAVDGWICNPTPDDGNEDLLEDYTIDRQREGVSLEQLLSDGEAYKYIKDLLNKQIDALHSKGFGKAIEVHGGSGGSSSSSSKKSTQDSDSAKTANMSSLTRLRSTTSFEALPAAEDDYQEKFSQVKEYLSLLFELHDSDSSGEMDTDEFRKFMDLLDLSQFGYTVEEVEAMMSFCDWDASGSVSFEEMINELTDMIINGIENTGMNVREFVKEKIVDVRNQGASGSKKKKKKKKKVAEEPTGAPDIAPDLLGYLQASFEAYDVDKNGVLDQDEFWQLLSMMNLNFSDQDIMNLQSRWDANADGTIQWKEILPKFVDVLHDLASDQRDHWIGLIDKDSQMLFWYNLRDQTSQWMSEEDQATYAAGMRSVHDH